MQIVRPLLALMVAASYGCHAERVASQPDSSTPVPDGMTVTEAPRCAISAPNTAIAIGATPTLSVSCDRGTAPFTYQWRKANTAIGNATSADYVLRADTDTATAGATNYAVTVTNSAGATTATATVVVAARAVTTCPTNAVLFFWTMTDLTYKAASSLGQFDSIPMVIQVDVGTASQVTTANRTEANLPKLLYVERPSFRESFKEVTISTSPCNFDNPEFVVSAASDFNQGGWKLVTVNDPRVTTLPRLTTGRWYINFRSVAGECPAGAQCNTNVQWIAP